MLNTLLFDIVLLDLEANGRIRFVRFEESGDGDDVVVDVDEEPENLLVF